MSNLRNVNYYIESLWDWTPYNECFNGTKIRITDIDGLVEHQGNFLVIETKRPGIPVPKGQEILFNRLTEDKRWHVLIIWGETNEPESWQVWRFSKVYHSSEDGHPKDLITRWFKYAQRFIWNVEITEKDVMRITKKDKQVDLYARQMTLEPQVHQKTLFEATKSGEKKTDEH
jgi:hypothetical protein